MKKRLIPILLILAYSALLIKIMVFKDVPPINIGIVTLNFGGINGDSPPNFIPFKTILPYLLGDKGLLIGGLNVVGNIIFLVPIGLLVQFFHRNLTWKKCLMLAIASGLAIELMQVVLYVGIFDIDDVILNAFGVMTGYWTVNLLLEWLRSKNYKTAITTFSIMTITVTALATLFVGDILQQRKNTERIRQPGNSDQPNQAVDRSAQVSQSEDLCGGTGGNGQITSVEDNSFTLKRNDGVDQVIYLTDQPEIHTSSRSGSVSDLKPGNRVTLVGGPNPDRSFTAEAVFVCNSYF